MGCNMPDCASNTESCHRYKVAKQPAEAKVELCVQGDVFNSVGMHLLFNVTITLSPLWFCVVTLYCCNVSIHTVQICVLYHI